MQDHRLKTNVNSGQLTVTVLHDNDQMLFSYEVLDVGDDVWMHEAF